MKLAILLLCHKNPEQINLFLDVLHHPNIKFFIHIDKKSNIADKLTKREDIIILPENERVLTKWGSVSLVKATLNLLKAAYTNDKFDYFWLCSGQDFPLKSAEEILSFLKANSQKEFLTLFESKAYTGKNTNYDKRTALYYPKYILNNTLFARVLKRLYIELTGGYNKTFWLKRKNTTGLTFYYGWQWWCLSNKMVKWILDYIKQKPEFLSFYENAIVPDESFFCTLVMNSPYAKNRVDALHYIDWSAGGNNPKILTMADLPALKKTSKLMARKFDLQVDESIFHQFCIHNFHSTFQAPIRILQIVGNLARSSGVNTVVQSWHCHMDTKKIQFDYLCYKQSVITRQQEIEELGGHCYFLPNPMQNPFKFLTETYRFFKTHRYNTIHSHITHLNFFFYPMAKIFGVKNIIQHAHGTKCSDKKLNGWRNYLMLHTVWPLITHKFACSQLAGEFWYGKNFTVINNGVDVKKFAYNPNIRVQKRKELKLENNFVIGNIGRFSSEKNLLFLIDIFEQVIKQDSTAKLVLVGGGPLENDVKKKVISLNLQGKVLFLGVRKDVPDLLQAFDVLCMPSLHEGLPMVGVEAQASGMPSVFADTITKEVLILPACAMLSLKDKSKVWANKVLSLKKHKRTNGVSYLKIKGFDIKDIAKQIENIYIKLNKE